MITLSYDYSVSIHLFVPLFNVYDKLFDLDVTKKKLGLIIEDFKLPIELLILKR